MIIEEIIYLKGAYSRKGNGLFVFRPLRLTPHDLRLRMTLCSMPACRRHGAMFTRRSLLTSVALA